MKPSDVNASNLLALVFASQPRPITDEERDDYLVGEGAIYIGFCEGLGFIVDEDDSVAVFDATLDIENDEVEYTWFRLSAENMGV